MRTVDCSGVARLLAAVLCVSTAWAEDRGRDATPTEAAEEEAAAPRADDPAIEPEAPPPAKASTHRVIEEIIVTAQKREQAVIDVPISMSVLDEEFLRQQGITDFRDVSLYVPNAKIRTSAVLPDIRIRGFGTSPVNPNFEQSVGLVLDGVPYSKKAYYQSALFDIGRVEVLRGPQGTMFGKNTTAGLLHVLSKDPTDDFTGAIDAEIGEQDYRHLEAGVGGPLVTNLVNFRIAGLVDERDGYVENTTAQVVAGAPETLFARDRKALRGKLLFPDLLGSTLKLTYERFDIDLTGGSEFRIVPERTRSFFQRFDPSFDFEPDNYKTSLDHFDGIGGDIDTAVANWGTHVFGWGLDAVGGFSILRDKIDNDTDNSPAPLAFVHSARDNLQYTFELIGSSPGLAGLLGLEQLFGRGLGTSNLVAGFFFQRRRLVNFHESLWLNSTLLAEFVALQQNPTSTPPPLPGSGEFVPGPPEQSTQFFDETADAFAGFGQADWTFFPRWTLSYGMRVSRETKAADTQRVFDTPTHVAFEQVLNWHEFDRQVDRTELHFAPKVSVNYKPTDDVSLFASWGRAFKGGGINAFASGGTDEELLFEDEKATQWAIDAKTRLLDGAAELNLSLFRMDLEDFQVLTTDPDDARITIENAAQARAQGVEADATWLPTDWLTVRGAAGFNDSEFLEFKIATCPQDKVNADGDADERCDVSGEPLDGAPRWTTALTTMAMFPVTTVPGLGTAAASFRDVGLAGGLTLEYQDTQFLNPDFDTRKRQPSFVRLKASMGLASLDHRWSVGVTAENLTNESVSVLAAETPTGVGHIWQFPDSPRLVYGQVRYSF